MTAFRALYLYEELLREFQRRMNMPGGFEETIETGLGYLMARLKLDHVGVYWWNKSRNCFQMQYALHAGTLMEGEEEIFLEPHGFLWDFTQAAKPIVLSSKKPWVAYLPITAGHELIGAVRFQRHLPLPRGAVLYALPSLRLQEQPTTRDYPLLEDIGDILSAKLQEIFREQKQKKKELYLRAGTEVATAVVETPRLRDMFETVGRSIVQNMGVDRVRIYLVDEARHELEGIVGIQIPNRIIKLDEEKYPLRDGANVLVDVVQTGSSQVFKDPSSRCVVYVPLVVGGLVLGVMAVDNLLSQQEIDEEQMNVLKTLAGQVGLAIINGRLFEDVEQQAITDGLTKLYVYRYFQQRLKEEMDRADRYSYSLALVMMDVDYFKSFNDTYGHQLGDQILEFLAQTIRSNIRRIDLAARYGGDEFVLLLPEITEQEAWLMGSRLLNALKNCTLQTPQGDRIPIGVSMGVALYPSDAQNIKDLIERADKALYWAKKNSRGDICFHRASVTDKAEKSA